MNSWIDLAIYYILLHWKSYLVWKVQQAFTFQWQVTLLNFFSAAVIFVINQYRKLCFSQGLYTAAYDLKMEWVVIKGISGYADGTTTSEGWEKFASVMAASIVANILRDSSVFQEWRHYGHEGS